MASYLSGRAVASTRWYTDTLTLTLTLTPTLTLTLTLHPNPNPNPNPNPDPDSLTTYLVQRHPVTAALAPQCG